MKAFSLKTRCSLLMLLSLASSSSLACTTLYIGDFLEFSKTQPVIVRATVSSHGAILRINADYFEEMTVTVTGVVKGDFSHDSVVFFGDTGSSCLRYITRAEFPIGSEHLFILESSDSRQPLLVAGESSVRVLGDTILGRDLVEEYSMPLTALLKLLE